MEAPLFWVSGGMIRAVASYCFGIRNAKPRLNGAAAAKARNSSLRRDHNRLARPVQVAVVGRMRVSSEMKTPGCNETLMATFDS
jgi:hypothetical protein